MSFLLALIICALPIAGYAALVFGPGIEAIVRRRFGVGLVGFLATAALLAVPLIAHAAVL